MVTLRDSADGLLKTHVQWEDVEKNMQAALGTTARFGPNKKVVHIGEGNGFQSRVGLVSCDWVGGEDGKSLPEKFALKITSGLAIKDIEANAALDKTQEYTPMNEEEWTKMENFLRDCHNLEATVYDYIRALPHKFASPQCYYTDKFSKDNHIRGQIALEYVSDSSIKHLYENHTLDRMKEIAREIGKMQAVSFLNGVDTVLEELKMTDVFTLFWGNFKIERCSKNIDSLRLVDDSPTMVKLVEETQQIFPEYFGSNLPVTLHKELGIKPVLVAGDMWSSNVLMDKESGRLKAFVDWQLAHLGTGCEDLFRIAFTALSSSQRRKHMDELLKEQYDSFVDNLHGENPPYTYEQLLDCAQLLMPHLGFFLAPMLMPMFKGIVMSSQMMEEQKAACQDIVLDKVRGIFEDILVYHRKNAASGRKFEWKQPKCGLE